MSLAQTTSNVGPGQLYSTIQAAIDAASSGDVINVYPGNYYETASNRSVFGTNGPHQFGLFIDKDNLTIRGVNADGAVITNSSDVAAFITTNSTANFGPSGVFVQSNNVTIQGLGIGDNIVNGAVSSNKTIEIIGDAFTMNQCIVNTSPDEGALYFGRWDAAHPISSYSITNNKLANTLVSINNGVGITGLNSGRIITGNTFTGFATPYLIGFRGWNGANPAQGWIVDPVGGAVVTGNAFNNSGVVSYIIARGNTGGYNNSQINWNEIWTSNTFGNHVVALANQSSFDVRSYNDAANYTETRRISTAIQENIAITRSGDVVVAAAGNYSEDITVNQSITLKGAGKGVSVIKGLKTGAAETILLGANNITLDGFTITRDGNTVVDWGTHPKKSGIGFGQLLTGITVQNCLVTGNRNGIYLNNTQGHTIKNNVITDNRTGVQLVNNVSNCRIENNEITNNWTMGFVIYYSDPKPASTNNIVTNNTITGNWYGSINSKTFGPNPSSSYNFAGNWYGANTLTVNTLASMEPGYESQIPVEFGGTAVNPGTHNAEINGDLSGLINYTPWIVVPTPIAYSMLNTPIAFDDAKAILTFTQMPPSTNATLLITRLTSPPAAAPALPANAGTIAPLFLDVTSAGLVAPFSVTITVDVSGIDNFSASTVVMFYNSDSKYWLSLGTAGKYDATNHTYTFTTDHFTTFGFANPTNPLNVYLTTDANDITKSVIYPNAGMQTALTTTPDGFNWTPIGTDWSYKSPKAVLYVIPEGTQRFIAANFKVKFDQTKMSIAAADVKGGDLFGVTSMFQCTATAPGELLINTASSNLNQIADGKKTLAELPLTILAPGYSPVTVTNVDFRSMDEATSSQLAVLAQTHSAAVKMYLGDFSTYETTGDPIIQSAGNGKVNFGDLVPFAAAYWNMWNGPSTKYQSKFDVGPTNASGSYFAMPKPDGKIDFEDLVIFSIGYGKSAASQLPKKNSTPVTIAVGAREDNGGEVRVPVILNGTFSDLRALSLTLNAGATFVRVEKAGEFATQNGFVIAKQENGKIQLDAAVIGADNDGLSKEGVIAYIVLKGTGSVSVKAAIGRNSRNEDVKIGANTQELSGTPGTFVVAQNYPNPFNPSTVISFGIPQQAMTDVSVFNSLGQKVATLVNEMKEAGYYNVSWNAAGMPSGMYFYHITAGTMTVTNKMILMK